MSGFLDNYETVESRLVKFWDQNPDGRVMTDLVAYSDTAFIVRAEVYRDAADETPAASGYAQETVSTKGVNSTSALENCETSAIGRALANLGFAAVGKRPSREEMTKTQRAKPATTTDPTVMADLRDGLKQALSLDSLVKAGQAVSAAYNAGKVSDADREYLRGVYEEAHTLVTIPLVTEAEAV